MLDFKTAKTFVAQILAKVLEKLAVSIMVALTLALLTFVLGMVQSLPLTYVIVYALAAFCLLLWLLRFLRDELHRKVPTEQQTSPESISESSPDSRRFTGLLVSMDQLSLCIAEHDQKLEQSGKKNLNTEREFCTSLAHHVNSIKHLLVAMIDEGHTKKTGLKLSPVYSTTRPVISEVSHVSTSIPVDWEKPPQPPPFTIQDSP